MISRREIFQNCLLGCAVGDSIGLPYEGISPRRCKKLLKRPLNHHFVFGKGMVSDDTDHTVFVAQSLIACKGDVDKFTKLLARRLCLWFCCLPAGIGLATLRSILKLLIGVSPKHSGVFSAGNGPSMRCAIIGAYFADNEIKRRAFVAASTKMTHTDPKALAAANAVAEIAAQIASGRWSTRPSLHDLAMVLNECSELAQWSDVVTDICNACASDTHILEIANKYGGKAGVSGYSWHSMPFAIICWYRFWGDFRTTIQAICEAGGDVDTNAAIAGALAGMAGEATPIIPVQWVEGIIDWPHSVGYLRRLATSLDNPDVRINTLFSLWLFPRGLLFTLLVLGHGFRRLLPPY